MTKELMNKHKEELHPHWEEGIPEPEEVHGPQHTREFKLRCRRFDTQFMDQVLHHHHQPHDDAATLLQDGEKHLKWDGTVMEPEHDPKHEQAFRARRKRFYNDRKMDQARKLLHAQDSSEENDGDDADPMDMEKE